MKYTCGVISRADSIMAGESLQILGGQACLSS